MSKKWVALLLVACVALAGGVVYVRMNADTKGPEIIISDNAGTLYRPDMNNEELLAGVTATDDKDGDVSPSLTVESVYEVDDTHVIITYTAKDSSNNITKQKYEMEMDSSSAPKNSNDNSGFGEKRTMQMQKQQPELILNSQKNQRLWLILTNLPMLVIIRLLKKMKEREHRHLLLK